MAVSKRGMRKLTVDGIEYLWKVCHAEWDSYPFPNLIALVALAEGGALLYIDFGAPRSDQSTSVHRLADGSSYTKTVPYAIATPGRVTEAIQKARAAGWEPETSGRVFTITLEPS